MRSKIVLIICLLVGTLLYMQPVAAAATITIDNLDDGELDELDDNACQLREALQAIGDVASGVDTDGDGLVQTVDGCDATNGDGVYTIDFGAGGTLVVQDTQFSGTFPEIPPTYNVTIDGSAGVTIQPPDASFAFNIDSGRTMQFINLTFAGGGQAIFNSGGDIIIDTVTFNNLTSGFEGGAVRTYGGSLTITDTLFSNNTSHNANLGGGALYTSGDTTLNNVTFQSNEADNSGGAIYVAQWAMEINGGTFNANVANGTGDFDGGGAIFNQDAQLTINGVTFSANQASAGSGGALYINNATTITGSLFTGNSATGTNNADNFTTEGGGAIYVTDETTVSTSALVGNTAQHGGGVMFRAGAYTITWDNSTIAQNIATGNGGGVFFGNSGSNYTVTLSNLTIAYNAAPTGAGIAHGSGGFAQLYQTLVANNIGSDCNGSISSLGYNLIQNSNDCSGMVESDIVDVGADLGAFVSAPTPHYLLSPGSPAVDTGDAAACPWNFDQRAFPRPVDGDLDGVDVCDIGAVEMPPGTGGDQAPVANDDSYDTDQDTPLNVTMPGVLANDTDAEGDPITAEMVSGVSNGTLAFNMDGSFTYTPDTNFVGTDSFTYTASDGVKDSNIATVTLNVIGPNATPIANDDNYTSDEDTLLIVDAASGVLFNDTDADGDTLMATLDDDVTNGLLLFSADGSFTYMPALNFTGTDSFTYHVTDGNSDSSPATVTITVDAVNDAPEAYDNNYVTDEDTLLSVDAASGVLFNDTDAENDVLTAVLVNDVSDGTLTLNSDGSFDYTPDNGFTGSDSFTYTATDAMDISNTATVNITVNPASNTAPVANDDNYNVDQDAVLNVTMPGVLGNDTDADGDTLESGLVTNVTNGTLTLNGDGSFDYMPDNGYTGGDSFTYTASDGTDVSNTATVTITVNPVASNTPPVVANDAYTMNLNTTLTISAPGVLNNDMDADGDPITAILNTDVSSGTLTLNSDGSFSYTPNPDYFGSDSFIYYANDGTDDSTVATVIITINQVASNIPPVANNDSYSTDQDTLLSIAAPGVLANDTDADGDTMTAVLVANVTNGTLTLNGDGSFDYMPDASYFGSDSFTYKANDGAADSNIVTVTINVNQVVSNTPPVANVDVYNTNQDTALNISLPGVLTNDTDVDGDALTAILVSGVTNGTLTLNSDGSFLYTPNAGFFGGDGFTYKANDGTADSNVAAVSITVNMTPANTAPVANADAYSIDQDSLLSITAPGVLGNDTDANGNTLTAILVSNVSNGTLTLNSDGSFDYTPNAGYFGDDSFTYKANDGTDDSNTVTVNITVNQVVGNTAPSANDDAYSTNQDTVLNIPMPGVLGNDTDVDGDALTAILVSGVTNGTLVLNSDGSFTYTPNSGYSGADSFTYTANDGLAASNTATVNITVNPSGGSNDVPVANGDAYSTDQDVALNIAAPGVLGNDTDADGDTLTVVFPTNPIHGTLAMNADGSFTYTPNAGYNGSDSFTYMATDGTANSVPATVSITVNAPGSTPEPTPTPTPDSPEEGVYPLPPDVPDAASINADEGGVVRVGVPDGLANAINVRVLYQNGLPSSWFGAPLYDGGAIGIDSVLQLGVLQAIDIFSPSGLTYFDGGAVFCLRGTGTLIWLAARNAPRVPEIIGSYAVDDFPGFTCATLFEPGTLVLVSHNPAA